MKSKRIIIRLQRKRWKKNFEVWVQKKEWNENQNQNQISTKTIFERNFNEMNHESHFEKCVASFFYFLLWYHQRVYHSISLTQFNSSHLISRYLKDEPKNKRQRTEEQTSSKWYWIEERKKRKRNIVSNVCENNAKIDQKQ